jgi:uncharacterized RDD family membrane protein YckC
MSSWFFVQNGDRVGPVGRAELDARIAEGVVRGDTLVWRPGMAAWARASELGELGLAPAAVTAPPLPVATAPDLSSVTEVAAGLARTRARAPVYAGFWVRLLAKIIDAAVLYAVSVVVQRVVSAVWFGGALPSLEEDVEGWLRFVLIMLTVNSAIAVGYSIYFILKHEATPGKRLLGLRVVRADGSRVGAGRVWCRYGAEQLSGLIFLVGYVMAAFDEEKRTLHDYMCDTRVVKGPREEEG